MTPAAWAILIQAAAPLGADLLRVVMGMFRKEAQGTPVTDAEWDALIDKWAEKAAKQYYLEAAQRAVALRTM